MESGEEGRESDSRICSSNYLEVASITLVLVVYEVSPLRMCFSLFFFLVVVVVLM